jgi:L-aspartate oxidase
MDGNRVAGVTYIDSKTSQPVQSRARSVLLATGGLGHVYRETTNPSVACGDGMAMAFRAGALLSDMEFVQFHPTALFVTGAPRFLLSEALRGEGAQLRNILLERFMPHYHELAELAPRDIVARAIIMEMQKSHGEFVYLDLTELDAEHVKKRFPRIFATCMQYNIDITEDLIPIRPAAHYSMGGVATDLLGATSLPGLFAAGEVAATGVHGANRLASNSLLEGLVFGARAATAMLQDHVAQPFPASTAISHDKVAGLSSQNSPDPQKRVDEARGILWDKVGIIRDGNHLAAAVHQLAELARAAAPQLSRASYEAANILTVAPLIARCALAREESRGAHYRSDFPLKLDTQPPQHSYITKSSAPFFA